MSNNHNQHVPHDKAELVLDAHAALGEGPVWDAQQGVLWWVNISAHQVHRFDPATGNDTWSDTGQPVGAAVVRASGGLVLALPDRFAAFDPATGRQELIGSVAAASADGTPTRMNDGKCDSTGRFWAGTMAFNSQQGAGTLYCLQTDHTVTRMIDNVTISNGVGWSLDNRTMYYIDTQSQGIDALSYNAATGQIGDRRRLITIPADAGMPDGMTVDSEGYLWVALWGGWAVHRYSPEGTLDRIVTVPASQSSSCAFGGPDLTDLYITSAAGGLTPEQLADQPHAGGLFRYRTGVRGLPTHAYGG